MTVLQVCAFAAPNAGNFIASLTHLENCLKEKGIDTIYAFCDGAQGKNWCTEIQQRTKVYFLPTAKARILPKTYQIFRQIYRENDIAIMHSHFELYDMPATVTAPKNTKIFWHLHDPIDFQSSNRKLLWKLQYAVVGKRAQLLAVADRYKETVVNLGFPQEQTRTILNGIDLNRVKPLPAKTAVTPVPTFLTFGWDFSRKGADLILDACWRLNADGYSFRLRLNGNEKTWPNLEAYLGGEDPAWLIRGMPVSDINELYQETDLFIQASRRETFSYAVCEAAYAGLPVVCSDIAGLEWAHELPTVAFFPSEDVDALYQLLKDYLDGQVTAAEQLESSRNVILDKYSLKTWVKKIQKAYDI